MEIIIQGHIIIKMKRYIYIILFCICSCSSIHVTLFTLKPLRATNFNSKSFQAVFYGVNMKTTILSSLYFYDNYRYRRSSYDTFNYDLRNIKQSLIKDATQYDYSIFEDGGYRINNNKISFQSIRYLTQFAYDVVTYEGNILNDSTILVYQYTFESTKERRTDSVLYHKIDIPLPDPERGNRWTNKKWFWQDAIQ